MQSVSGEEIFILIKITTASEKSRNSVVKLLLPHILLFYLKSVQQSPAWGYGNAEIEGILEEHLNLLQAFVQGSRQ